MAEVKRIRMTNPYSSRNAKSGLAIKKPWEPCAVVFMLVRINQASTSTAQ